jgi:hypothetical protein
MPRKTTDPRLIALLDQKEKLAGECEHWWRRLRRAVNELEKRRRQLARLDKRAREIEQPARQPA